MEKSIYMASCFDKDGQMLNQMAFSNLRAALAFATPRMKTEDHGMVTVYDLEDGEESAKLIERYEIFNTLTR